MAGGRRKTDTLQYKTIVGIISTVTGVILSLSSFFLGQGAAAHQEGYNEGVQNEKIAGNVRSIDTLTTQVKEIKKTSDDVKDKVTKIDGKIDLLIKQNEGG